MSKSAFERLFGRGPQVLLFTIFYMIVMMASVIGATTADTLFLSHYDITQLSYMYLYITAAVVLVGMAFQKVSERISAHRLMSGAIGLVVLFIVLTALLLTTEVTWIYPVIFVGYEAINVLVTMAFFTFMASVMDARQAKRYIGTVAAGGVGGAIVGGFAASRLASFFGTDHLVYVYAALILSGLWFVRRLFVADELQADSTPHVIPPVDTNAQEQPQGNLFKQLPILKYIAIIIGTISVAITLTDYQFKMTLAQTLSENELARFIGNFYSITGVIAFIFQVFISTRLLTRYGIVPSFLVMPLSMLASSIAFFFAPVLITAVVLKVSYRAFAETIHQSVSELMYFPIPAHLRGRAKGLVNGVIDYGMSGVAAILLIILADRISLTSFSIIAAVMLTTAVLAIFPVKREYVQMLLASLKQKQQSSDFDLSMIQAPILVKVIEDRSPSISDRERLHAFRLLAKIPHYEMERHLPGLLAGSSTALQVEVLRYMEQEGWPQWRAHVLPLLQSGHSLVQAQAIQTFAAHANQEERSDVAHFLHHPQAEIRIAAIYGLLKYFGPDETLGKALLQMLHDPHLPVRRLALEAIGKLADPRMLPEVLAQLKQPGMQKAVLAALSLFPLATLLALLQTEWDKPDADEAILRYTAKMLEQHATPDAYLFLLQAYEKAPTSIRARLADALFKLSNRNKGEHQKLVNLLEMESQHVRNGLQALHMLQEWPEAGLVIDALTHDSRAALKNLFALLSLLYEKRTIEKIAFNLESGDAKQKANALEALDNLLSNQLRVSVMPAILANYDGQTTAESAGATQPWKALYEKADAWLQTCLLYVRELDSAFAWESDPPAARALSAEEEERITQVRLLKEAGSFSDLPGSIIAKFAAVISKQHMEKGTTIIRQGEVGHAIYLLLAGEADVIKDGHALQRLSEGELFGEMSLFDSERRSASIVAATPVTVGMIEEEVFMDLLNGNLELAISVASMLSKRIRVMNERHGSSSRLKENLTAAHKALPTEVQQGQVDKEAQSLTEKIMILLKVDMFSSLSHEQLAALAELTEEVTYQAGQMIVQYGEAGNAMYGIIAGSVLVEREGRTIAQLHQGDVFGEMALLERAPRSATVTAQETSVLVKISDQLFYDFCYGDETIISTIIGSLAARLRLMTKEAAARADVS